MQVKDLDLPVPYHETMDVNDSSKIQSFQDCPRGFFFRYVLGFEKDEQNRHLVFGSAWHDAMEHIYNNGTAREEIGIAYEKFLATYREGFPNEITDDERRPKDPGTALKALASYGATYRGVDQFEVLYTEVTGTVPVRSDRVIHCKTDAIVRDDGSIWSHEHKTTGRNSSTWRDKWSIKIQVGSYSHLLFAAFPNEHVEGVKINGAVFTKSRGADFLRIPVRKTAEDMQQYLWEVNHWLDQMEWNFNQLEQCTNKDDVMTCFPKNAESCSKFGCRYPGLCSAWNNPLKHVDRPPPGYKVEFWDPRRMEEESRNVAKPDEEGNLVIKKRENDDSG